MVCICIYYMSILYNNILRLYYHILSGILYCIFVCTVLYCIVIIIIIIIARIVLYCIIICKLPRSLRQVCCTPNCQTVFFSIAPGPPSYACNFFYKLPVEWTRGCPHPHAFRTAGWGLLLSVMHQVGVHIAAEDTTMGDCVSI